MCLQAAIKGEEWCPTYLDESENTNKKRVKSLHPPKKPPPRLGAPGQGGGAAVSVDAIEMDMTDGTGANQGRGPASPDDRKPTRPPPRPRTAAREGVQTVSS